MDEYISREATIKRIKEVYCVGCNSYHGVKCRGCGTGDAIDIIEDAPAADVEKMSDGYHTFADLYEQRLILSAALAKNNPHAWKSKRHDDGSVPFGGGWFIMGFETDEGCYTYHYELKDWDLFQCKELDKGKPWDGHTSKDVRRLFSIPSADVAPVVHCRDCANFRQNAHGVCWCDEYGGSITPNDYCSRAVSDKQPLASIPWEAD